MIHGLDHVTLAAASPSQALDTYARLLGHPGTTRDGVHRIETANSGVRFVAGVSGQPEGLAGLAFAVRDLPKARNLLERRGMRVLESGSDERGAKTLLIATDSTHGVAISLVERENREEHETAAGPGTASGLDHAVIRTPNPERAVALYAGRLGLSLRLDRSEPSWGARLLFFRCGDLVIEVAHDLKTAASDASDSLWGLSWRVGDIYAAHKRLRNAGVEVSDVRAGRRPGSKVFTVRSPTAGVPTIMIGMDGERKPPGD